MALVFAAVHTALVLALPQPALQLGPTCRAATTAYCDANCAITRAECHQAAPNFTALKSDPSPVVWRCYQPQTLDKAGTAYSHGSCYCSRDAGLRAVLAKCGEPDPSPPPPPAPHPHPPPEFPLPAVPEIGRGTASTAVFWRGQKADDGTVYPCVRIPAIINADGVLLAFAECRRSTGDGCEPRNYTSGGTRDICTRRSEDGGKEWGPMAVIAKNAGQDTAVYDAVTKTVIVNLNMPENGQIISTDLGKSWGAPTPIALDRGSSAGPGVGIQLGPTNPYHPGRLLFIGHSGAYVQDYVWYSDDHGKTYDLAKTATGDSLLEMDEAQLVELANGDVLASMRNKVSHGGGPMHRHWRGVALSTDGGTTFGAVGYDTGLPEPVCMGSIIRSPPPLGDGAVYFANPGQGQGRVVGKVRRAVSCTGLPPKDCTWTSGDFGVYHSGDFAYSCLSPLNATHVGLLWETNTSLCVGPSCLQVFTAIPVAAFVQ